MSNIFSPVKIFVAFSKRGPILDPVNGGGGPSQKGKEAKMIKHKIDGLPVVNSKKPLKLVILDKDIKRANVKKPDSCAIAQACRRQEHAEEVRVHLSRVYIKNGNQWTRYNTGKALRSEIIAFDRGGKFAPGAYLLAKQVKRKRGQQGTTTNQNVRGGKKRRKPHVVTDVRTGPV